MKPIRLFSSDLDGTLAGDRNASQRFNDYWQALEPASRPLLVYNSGRLVDDMADFVPEQGLPQPDIFIGGVGTMLSARSHAHLHAAFIEALGEGYDAEKIAASFADLPRLTLQPERYQHAYKSSWYLHDAEPGELDDIAAILRQSGLKTRIVYSSGRDLDVIPTGADKGQALTWLCRALGISLDEVVVAGDTGNDRAMFELDGVRGIIPANALSELLPLADDAAKVFKASQNEADGIVEGLRHWQTN
ncbi:MAG: HAD-IIB family hydrolase [Allorhizobium sp.]